MIDRIAGFLESVGLPCRRGTILEATVLPGILLQDGGLVYDADTLLYPGDLLHEAGHLAVMSPERRMRARPAVGKYAAEEMMAIAWSYAAAVHLHLDPAVVFHKDGYRGGSASLIAAFSAETPVGVPMLQWLGMTMDAKRAIAAGVAPFPAMIRWLNDGSRTYPLSARRAGEGASEPRERASGAERAAKRRASDAVGESEGRSPSDESRGR